MLNFLRKRRRCPHGLEQRFLGDDYVPVGGFIGGGQSSFCNNFSKFIFYNSEDGLSVLRLQTICYIEPVLAFGTEQDIIVNSRRLSPQRSQRSSCLVSVSKSALQEVLS
jgi:hypothetical protein